MSTGPEGGRLEDTVVRSEHREVGRKTGGRSRSEARKATRTVMSRSAAVQ
jgi:hypothetical protein